MPVDLEQLNLIVSELEADREPWIPLFQDIQEYLLPDRGLFTTAGQTPNSGDKHGASIYDDAAGHALDILAAGMQGGLTSPRREWFKLGFEDHDLEQFGPVKMWLSQVERVMYKTLAQSNFYQEAHSIYIEQGGYGTSCLLVDVHPTKVVRFRNLTIGTYAIGADDLGVINTLSRRMFRTPQQLAQQFGEDKLSSHSKGMLERKSRERVEVIHLVQPREGWDDRKSDKANMPFESIYWEAKVSVNDNKLLDEGGYREFPFLVPRWGVVGDEVWGRSPGMKALSDIEMLQEMDKTSIMAIHKSVDPPVMGTGELMDDLDTSPGGQNVYSSEKQLEGFKPLYEVKLALAEAEAKIVRREEAIARRFHSDLFLMLANLPRDMTAFEVAERTAEKMLQLGPVIERQQNDFHDPLIDRTFEILVRAGKISPPPEEIAGMDMKVEYIGILALAQLREQLGSIQELARFTAALGEFIPEAVDKFDADKAIDHTADVLGTPPEVVRDAEQVAGIRQQRAAAQAKQAQMDAVTQGADAAKTLSEIDLTRGGGANAGT